MAWLFSVHSQQCHLSKKVTIRPVGAEGSGSYPYFNQGRGGQMMPTILLKALPPDFQTFLRPWTHSSLPELTFSHLVL